MDNGLKCFVACAFGRQDVDKMYAKVLLPTLKGHKIKTLRVDLINHNKNIDQKIVELIRDCDFGIVDLTYARPSVYYEAGYIHGLGKEVIFSVRNDHFKPDNNDLEGNRRIHFDLITKNIIGWSEGKSGFQRRLKSRINLITTPILKAKNTIRAIEKEEKDFELLSIINRIETIKNESVDFLKIHKYKIVDVKGEIIRGWKKDGTKKKVVMAFIYDNLTLKKLSDFNSLSWLFGKISGIDIAEQSTITIVFNVLRPLNIKTIQRAFPNNQLLPDKKELIQNESLTGRKIRYIFLDNIRSVTDYKSKQKVFEGM